MTVKEKMSELLGKLEDLEDRLFDVKMKDRWDSEDYSRYHKLTGEILDVKKELKTLGWEG